MLTEQAFVDDMVSRLNADLQRQQEDPSYVSWTAQMAPKTTCTRLKATAKKIALTMFGVGWARQARDHNEPTRAERMKVYIEYNTLLNRMREAKPPEDQERQGDRVRKAFKEARGNGQCQLYQQLKTCPVSPEVLNPVAMPVTIAPAADFTPFLNCLASDTKDETGAVEVTDTFVRFPSGTVFRDGRVDLCKRGVGAENIKAVLDAYRLTTACPHFLFGNNISGRVGAEEIAKYIRQSNSAEGCSMSKVETWYLAGNAFDSEAIAVLAGSLEQDQHCRALWLKRNPIRWQGAASLNWMLRINHTLVTLDLQNCGLFDEGVKFLVAGLAAGNDTLRNLYLDANGIEAQGAMHIANYFLEVTRLGKTGVTGLWLDMNRLGDEGIVMLASALRTNTTLERLVVGSNRITGEAANVLCFALRHHPTLIQLFLGAYLATADMGELTNRIGDRGAGAVANLLRENKVLKLLSIAQNDISNVGLGKVAHALEENTSLLYCDFQQFGLQATPEIKASIHASLSRNIASNLDGMTFQEFQEHSLKRELQHTKDVWNIDSIYRNNGRMKKRVEFIPTGPGPASKFIG